MITEKLIMPYILASMHPLIHMTCFIVDALEKIDYLNGGVKPNDSLHNSLDLMIFTHVLCGVLEFAMKMF